MSEPRLPISGIWSVPITAYHLFLSGRVGWQRKQHQVIVGDRLPDSNPDNLVSDPLHTAIRAHANFLENIPLAMILAVIAELNGMPRRYLHWALASFFAVRVVHVELGLMRRGTQGLGRFVGYWGTNAWFIGMASWVGYCGRGYWGWK